MDLSYTDEQEAFRAEARAWLRDNVPSPPLASPGTKEGFAAHRDWERQLYEAGYGALHWPVELGGRGADVILQAIFEEEYLLAGGPERISVVGQRLMGPTLMVHGTDEQRRRWLPPMLTGKHIWSQGFSEPEAGSDLANIRTTGVRDGDDWVLNGQKIWTSFGAYADWMFALVRTDPQAPKKHAGLTFLALDMRTPGVDVRPIVQLDGHAGFAEVFFDDVRVPADQVVGEVHGGWGVAMTTLGVERDSPSAPPAQYARDVQDLADLVRAAGLAGDEAVRDQVAALLVRAEAYRCFSLRTLSKLARGEQLGSEASLTKLLWSELERDVFDAGLEVLGTAGEVIAPAEAAGADPEWHHRYWYARAATIYAGTSEIQRNIVAERVLGLPR